MNYQKGMVNMFSFVIMLSTLTCLVPYLFSSVVEITLYLKNSGKLPIKKLFVIILISIPAFLYSAWAVIGLGWSVILWGLLLLALGIPIYFYSTTRDG